jgi:hypothetical protein
LKGERGAASFGHTNEVFSVLGVGMRNIARPVFVLSIAVITACLLVLGPSAQADHDPGGPDVDIIAIDADITGNTETHIESIESCASIAGPGSTATIDIIVDQVPVDGTTGINADFIYNPAVLRVTALNFDLLLGSGGPMSPIYSSDTVPDSDGDFRFDVLDISANVESGEGVMARLTLEAVGNGISILALADTVNGDQPDVLDSSGTPYFIHNVEGGSIAVGQACAPTTDLAASAATVSAAPAANAGVAFNVVAGGTIQNNGPVTTVNADATISISTPADCTVAGGSTRSIADTSLTVGSPVTLPNQTFSVTCTSPSFHTFSSNVTVTLDDVTAAENVLGNNQASSSPSTTAVTATSDVQLQSVTITTSQFTPSPMAGIDFDVTAAIGVLNNGPDGPTSVSGSATLTVPADCFATDQTPYTDTFSGDVATGPAQTFNAIWQVACQAPGNHTFGVSASITASDQHVVDAGGNNSGSSSLATPVKIGACGDDPDPDGDPIQSLSPQLLLLVQSLTATGTPTAEEFLYPIDCTFDVTARDQVNTPINECPVAMTGELPCSLKFDLAIDVAGGSSANEPSVRLNPVGVTFLPAAFDWANDTEIPNGSKTGSADFSIRTDAGELQRLGLECTITPVFDVVLAVEGGIQGNVPESNDSDDLLNPNVWPNDLNAERALVEESFSAPLPIPIPGDPIPSGVTLWSRSVVRLAAGDQVIPMNILVWKVTNPLFQVLTGANWVIVPFPSDALNPDAPGTIGGNPDSDDPAGNPALTYCAPHSVSLQFDGKVGNVAFISCHTAGTPMTWNLVDPDALNTSGDEGPRTDVTTCSADADGDGLSAGAETYWGSNPNAADTDGDLFLDANEVLLTTNPANACADTAPQNDEPPPDAWPVDFNDNQIVNGQDVGAYGIAYGRPVGAVPNGPRYDFNMDGIINGQDVGKFATTYGTHC